MRTLTISSINLKKELHQRIEIIEDENLLLAFLTILDNLKNETKDYELNDVQIKELEKRDADYLSGKSKSYTLEEFQKTTKKKFGF